MPLPPETIPSTRNYATWTPACPRHIVRSIAQADSFCTYPGKTFFIWGRRPPRRRNFMANLPQQGESLPDLEFTTESGERIGTGRLTGQKTVLYFYPKDDTPGCTKEACAFRDRRDK